MPPKNKYTDPKLRDQVKHEIQESDKGGAPGQWSARKAQMMASEYKKRGGGYNTDKSQQDESQKNLSKWSEEEWQTKEGSGNAKQEDGTEKGYLPKKAWEKMTDKEKEQTDDKKLEGGKEGKQFVQNTGKARQSRRKVNEEESAKYESKKAKEKHQNSQDEYDDSEDADAAEDDEEAQGDDHEEIAEEAQDVKPKQSSAGQKRKQQSGGSTANKKQKSTKQGETGNAPKGKVGSKHMDAAEPAPRGSTDRLPNKGANITWKAMPGYVDGTVEEILTNQKKVDGKTVKASKNDPRLVLKSSSSGKICVHKPDACFYD